MASHRTAPTPCQRLHKRMRNTREVHTYRVRMRTHFPIGGKSCSLVITTRTRSRTIACGRYGNEDTRREIFDLFDGILIFFIDS